MKNNTKVWMTHKNKLFCNLFSTKEHALLLKNKSEMTSMILTEYDEELHNETLREEGREDGMEEGIKLTKTVFTLRNSGKADEDIAKAVDIPLDKVKRILY